MDDTTIMLYSLDKILCYLSVYSLKCAVCTQYPSEITAERNLVWYRRTNMSENADDAYNAFKQRYTVVNERLVETFEEVTFVTPPDSGHMYVISPDEPIPESMPQEMAACPKTITLSSYEGQSTPFKRWIRSDNDTNMYAVPVDGDIIAKFFLDPILDIGGTIEVTANIDSQVCKTSLETFRTLV